MKKESIKIDREILEKAKELKEKTGIPIGTQFEKSWTTVHQAIDTILINSKLLQSFLAKVTSLYPRYDGATIDIKCKDGLLSFGRHQKTLNVQSNDWQTEKTTQDLNRLYKFLLTFSDQPLSVSFTAHSLFIDVNGILV